MATANIKAVITAEDRASAALRNFGNNASTMGNKIKKGLKIAAVGIAAAGAAAIAFGVSSVKSFSESQASLAQLNSVLKSTKGVAGVTAKAATNLANSLQKVTKFSDEEVLSAENLLLTFKGIGKDVFPRATKAVLDLSTTLNKDLGGSAIQLGKALQDPIRGITALRKSGIDFTKKQQETIRALVESGKTAEAQRLILKELESQVQGSAEAYGKTFPGQLAILKNSFDEVKESIGLAIVNGITPLMAKLAEFVNSDKFQAWLVQLTTWLEVNLPIAINYVVNELIPNLVNIFNMVWPVLRTVLVWLGKFINFLANHEVAVWTFIGVIAAMKAAMVITSTVTAFKAGLAAIRGAYALTSGVLSVPIPITILVGAALIAMGLIIAKAKQTMDVLDQLGDAQRNSGSAFSDSISRLRQLAKTGTPAQRKRAKAQLANPALYSTADSRNASGTDFSRGGMTLVGERGAEMVSLPRGSKVHRADETRKMMGGATTINITVPMMTGSANERRKVARMLIKDIQDIAQMNGKSVTDMMSSNYGLVT